MNVELAQPLALYLLVLAALGTVASAGYFTTVEMLGFFAAVVGSWFVPLPFRQRLNRSRVIGLVLVGLFLLVGYQIAFAGADIVGGAATFLVLVLVSRLFTERTTLEARQILLLSLLVVLAGSALSISFAFAPYFILFIVFSVWALTTTQLTREIEARRAQGHADAGAGVRVSGRFLLTTSVLSVLIFLQTSAFFLAFPRFGVGYFRLAQRSGKQVVGYTDKVELGASGSIGENAAVALRLEFPNGDPPNASQLYFRGATLSDFDGHRWSRAASGFGTLKVSADGYVHLRGVPDPKAIAYRLYQEPSEVDAILLPEPTSSFALRREAGTPFMGGLRLLTSQGLDVIAARAPTTSVKVDGWLSPAAAGISKNPPLPTELMVPESLDPRVKALAATFKGDEPDDIAQAAMAYLRQGFTYTTTLTAPGLDVDPITFFLFDSKAGHCEYFASATAVMLRTRGIPARLVSGYLGATFNRYGSYWFVSENRAHSWVEYYDKAVGWVRIDPTPSQGRPTTRNQSSSLAELIDLMHSRWNRYVIEFSLDTQISAVQSVQKMIGEKRSTWSERPPAIGDFFARHVTTLLVAALVGLSGWLWWLRRRIVRRQISAPTRLYRRFAKRLLGRTPPAEQLSPHVVARLGKTAHPDAAPAIDRFTDAYLAARFGGDLGRVGEMRAAFADVKRALR